MFIFLILFHACLFSMCTVSQGTIIETAIPKHFPTSHTKMYFFEQK